MAKRDSQTSTQALELLIRRVLKWTYKDLEFVSFQERLALQQQAGSPQSCLALLDEVEHWLAEGGRAFVWQADYDQWKRARPESTSTSGPESTSIQDSLSDLRGLADSAVRSTSFAYLGNEDQRIFHDAISYRTYPELDARVIRILDLIDCHAAPCWSNAWAAWKHKTTVEFSSIGSLFEQANRLYLTELVVEVSETFLGKRASAISARGIDDPQIEELLEELDLYLKRASTASASAWRASFWDWKRFDSAAKNYMRSVSPQEKKNMPHNTHIKNLVAAPLIRGAQTAAADEAGKLVLEMAQRFLGDSYPEVFKTPQGQNLAKVAMAAAIKSLAQNGVLPFDTGNLLSACDMIMEAAGRDTVQPMIVELTPAFKSLAALAPKTEE